MLVLVLHRTGSSEKFSDHDEPRDERHEKKRKKISEKNVVPSSAGGNSSFELHSQSMEERATLDRYHHFHGHSGMCA